MSYGRGWKEIKEQIRFRDKVCRTCGKTAQDNGRALDVHHVDPFRFSNNNDPENLEALCRACHMCADDHGRKGHAKFLMKQGIAKRPTKREIRRLRALADRAGRNANKRSLQQRARRLSAEGKTLRFIAGELGVSHPTVFNWLRGRHTVGEGRAPYLARLVS